jgi:hypothetical protein
MPALIRLDRKPRLPYYHFRQAKTFKQADENFHFDGLKNDRFSELANTQPFDSDVRFPPLVTMSAFGPYSCDSVY